jgi:hypothetical protein
MQIFLVATAVLLPLASPAATPDVRPLKQLTQSAPKAECVDDRVHHATGSTKPEAKSLGELPPGDLHLTVHRQVDGCVEPVIVRHDTHDFGKAPAAPAPARPLPAGERLLAL